MACLLHLSVMCVMGSHTKFPCFVGSFGEWSRAGCQTEVSDNWHVSATKPFLVNCTCNHLSTFAVLVDVVDMQVSISD
jgi:hypothetical protein